MVTVTVKIRKCGHDKCECITKAVGSGPQNAQEGDVANALVTVINLCTRAGSDATRAMVMAMSDFLAKREDALEVALSNPIKLDS